MNACEQREAVAAVATPLRADRMDCTDGVSSSVAEEQTLPVPGFNLCYILLFLTSGFVLQTQWFVYLVYSQLSL